MSLKNAMIGFILNLLASGGWQYLSDEKVNPIIVGSAIIWVFLLLNYGREDSTDSFLRKLWRKVVPQKTIEFIPYTDHGGFNNYWNSGELNGKPAMLVEGEWYATNRTDASMRLLRAYLVKPRTEGSVCTEGSFLGIYGSEETFGNYSISPGECNRVRAMLRIQPPICEEGEDFIGKIVFIDQLNRRHKVKVTFEFRS